MKRIEFFIVVIPLLLILSACGNKDKSKNSAQKADTSSSQHDTLSSLNGITQSDALAYIADFPKHTVYDATPQRTSFWFSKEDLNDIVSLLDTEISKERSAPPIDPHDPQKGITDGIRIYLACNKSDFHTLHFKIILVSTMDNGPSSEPTCTSRRLHLDYYNHASTAPLFQYNQIGGLKSQDDCGGGAQLYDNATCDTCDKNCDFNQPHYLKYSECAQMVSNYGNDTINTHAEWFDYHLLKSIVNYGNKPNSSFAGIRIYFARHSTDDDTFGYPDRSAFVIVTTKYDSKISNYSDVFDCRATQEFFDYLAKRAKKSVPTTKKLNPLDGVPGQDNGELCPKNCN